MTLSSANSNPLSERQGWSGNSSGFISTAVNLPPASAGQEIQLRWRCGTGDLPPAPLASTGTLAYWNFDSNADASLRAPSITTSPVAVQASGPLTFFEGDPGFAIASRGFTQALGPPNSAYSYFAFSLTVTNGYQARLSGISFENRASSTGPSLFDVQISQQASFSSVIYDSGALHAHVDSGSTVTWGSDALTLTNSGLTGTIYFRIYAYAASGSLGTWRLDNLSIRGVVTGAVSSGSGWYLDSVSIDDSVCCGASATGFRILSASITVSGDVVAWSVVPEKSYQPQLSAALGTGWQDIGPPLTASVSDTTLSITNAVAPDPTNRFYRISLLPSP